MKYQENINFVKMANNLEKLINILNHRVTKLEVNVSWLKKLSATQTGLLAAIFLAIFGLLLKTLTL